MSTHYTTCCLCEASCGIAVEVEDGRVTDLRGDPDDPLSRGHICPKATALSDLQEDPDRLRQPMKRTAEGFVPCSWEEALDATVSEIHRIQSSHGRDAVGLYLGNPNVHNAGSLIFGPPWIRTLRTRNTYSATSVDQLPQMLAAAQMFGHQLLLPVPDVDRTDLFVIIGANPLVSNGSLMTAPDMRRRMKAIQARGGRIVVIDPRRTETARRADEHLFIRPGTDALLLMALISAVFERGEVIGPHREIIDGIEALRTASAPFSPEAVAPITGVDAEHIRALATALRDTPRAAVYGRVGACTQEFGGLTAWLINALNILTGHLDVEGGMMFTQPAFDAIYPPGQPTGRGRRDRWRSRVRDRPEFAGELPVAVLAEEILTPGEGQIRGMVVWAGNPVLSTPNGTQLDRAFAGLEFCVAVDFYINETSRHAHYILPPAPPLSRAHCDVIFHLLQVRNTVKYSPAVLPLEPEVRHDWQILHTLKTRLERKRGGVPLTARLQNRAVGALGPRGLIDAGLRLGRWGLRQGTAGISVRKLERNPHGVDLGPLQPCLAERMPPDHRRIPLAPRVFLDDLDRLRARLEAPPDEGLVLIGRRQLRSNNSWLHNAPRLMKGKDRCTLLIHPEDAAERDISDGAEVAIASRTGQVVAPAEISAEVMRGVVSLPHGFGHGRPGVRLSVAGQRPGVSANDLTDDHFLDELSGNAALSGVPVTVSAC